MNEETWMRIYNLIDEWLEYERIPGSGSVFLLVCQKTVDCLRPRQHDGNCWPTEVKP